MIVIGGIKIAEKHAGGRPRIKIDYEAVEKLASIGCTQEEIADFLGCSVRTLLRNKKFCQTYKRGISHSKRSLRRMQFDKASKGNTTMLIWLGKQMLGQREKVEQTMAHEIEDLTPLADLLK